MLVMPSRVGKIVSVNSLNFSGSMVPRLCSDDPVNACPLWGFVLKFKLSSIDLWLVLVTRHLKTNGVAILEQLSASRTVNLKSPYSTGWEQKYLNNWGGFGTMTYTSLKLTRLQTPSFRQVRWSPDNVKFPDVGRKLQCFQISRQSWHRFDAIKELTRVLRLQSSYRTENWFSIGRLVQRRDCIFLGWLQLYSFKTDSTRCDVLDL